MAAIRPEIVPNHLSGFVVDTIEEAVAARGRHWRHKETLEGHHFKILAEIDLRHALRRHLAVDFRPYLVLSACSLPLGHRAIQADANVGSILFCNVVVQLHEKATINHVDLMWTARELRTLIQQAIEHVETLAKSQNLSPQSEVPGRPLAHALS